MHLTVAMEGVNDRTLAQQARQFQLAPAALSHFYLDPQRARSGLVLGYGNTSASRYLPALRTPKSPYCAAPARVRVKTS